MYHPVEGLDGVVPAVRDLPEGAEAIPGRSVAGAGPAIRVCVCLILYCK